MKTKVKKSLSFLILIALLFTEPLFAISAKENRVDIAKVAKVRITTKSYVFNGREQVPEVEVYIPAETAEDEILLRQNKDYILMAENNKDVGTATYVVEGINQYQGVMEGTFEIKPYDVNELIIKDNLGTKVLEYNGKERVYPLSIYIGTFRLNPGDDYFVNYENNLNVGTATMTITSDNFNTDIEKTFEIAKKNLKDVTLDITVNKDNTVTVSGVNPEAGQSVREGIDFTTTVEKNGKGYLIITIKAKEKNYTGTIVKKVEANPEPVDPVKKKIASSKVKISKVTQTKKKITLRWKKIKYVQGYQIRYGTKSTMKGAVVKKTKNVNNYSLKNLKRKATYYVQVRGFKIVEKKYYYSKWSSKKKIKKS